VWADDQIHDAKMGDKVDQSMDVLSDMLDDDRFK